jgi:hypothetical protein
MTDREGCGKPMYTHFTDAENTGAPMVPDIAGDDDVMTDGGQGREDLEEIVLSHRIEE